jgi:predicted AlkP superfamily pyrophosphatase or phosphodiesterase
MTAQSRLPRSSRLFTAVEVAMSFRSLVLTSAVLSLATTSAAFADSTAKATGKVTDHVIVISIDGLRPDAITKFGARTLLRLMREGSYSLQAQTILPSKTLPSHTSMVTGVDADRHGITWNNDQTDDHGHVDVPTMFGLARETGFRTAAFFSKTKFHHLETPNSLDYVRSPRGGVFDDRWPAAYTTRLVKQYIDRAPVAPNLVFVHIGEPDYAGHLFGWMGSMYAKAVLRADEAVDEIIDEAEDRFGRGNFTVIVTADHGGHGRNHGSSDPRDTTIPWIVWGEGVQGGTMLTRPIRTMDTAATALWMLGVQAPEAWVGKPVAAAFTQSAIFAATN